MKIIGVKRKNPNDERLGYIKALLVDEQDGWIKATRENVPSTGEVFVPRNFSLVEKFADNEIFLCDSIEPIEISNGSCDYLADGANCSSLNYYEEDVFSLIDINETLGEAETLRVYSNLRPTTLCFVRTLDNEETVIAGPYQSSNVQLAQDGGYNCLLSVVGANNKTFPSLKAFSIFRLSVC